MTPDSPRVDPCECQPLPASLDLPSTRVEEALDASISSAGVDPRGRPCKRKEHETLRKFLAPGRRPAADAAFQRKGRYERGPASDVLP